MLSPSPQSPSLLRALAAGALCAAHFYPLGGCGEIAPSDNGEAGSPHQGGDAGAPHDAATQTDAAGENSAHVRFEATAPGAGTLAIDASDAERWIYVDLDARREVFPSEPGDDSGPQRWDIAFRRFHAALNGGVSGTGGVSATRVDGQALEEVTPPADALFLTDQPDGDDDDAVPDYVVSGGVDPWYAYDVTTHVLTPKPRVYVLRTTEGAVFRLAFERYYDDAGGSGHPSLRFALWPPR